MRSYARMGNYYREMGKITLFDIVGIDQLEFFEGAPALLLLLP